MHAISHPRGDLDLSFLSTKRLRSHSRNWDHNASVHGVNVNQNARLDRSEIFRVLEKTWKANCRLKRTKLYPRPDRIPNITLFESNWRAIRILFDKPHIKDEGQYQNLCVLLETFRCRPTRRNLSFLRRRKIEV